MNTADKAVKFLVENGIWNQFNQDTGEATITKYFLIETLSKFAASQSSTPLQVTEIEKLLPSDRELEILDNSILAADPTKQDVLIKDLKKQINKITNKVRKSKAARVDEQSKDLKDDFVLSVQPKDLASVVSHSCTDNNSIQQCERILCSAIWFDDGKEYVHQPKNVKSGFVVAGRRHNNCYSTLQAIGSSLGLEGIARNHIERIDRDKQGFITNLNRYVDRKEGFQIAQKAGQLLLPELHSHQENPILTSEDLW